MSTGTLNSSSTVGITLASAGVYSSPFTITSAGTINTTSRNGVYSALGSPNLPTLANAGQVTGGFYGVLFENGGVVTNSASSARIQGNSGILLGGSTGITNTVVNQGTISGSTGFGIASIVQAKVTNSSNALIQGKKYGVQLYGGSGTVINQGTISGATDSVVFSTFPFAAAGNNRLVADAGAVFNGNIVATGAGNTLEFGSVSSGTSVFAANGGSISGFQTLAFDPGATWAVDGDFAALNNDTVLGLTNSDMLFAADFVIGAMEIVTATAGGPLDVTAFGLVGSTVESLDLVFSSLAAGTTISLFAINGGTGIEEGVHTASLSSFSSVGITLTSGGSDLSPFTITPSGTISAMGTYGVFSMLGNVFGGASVITIPTLVNEGIVSGKYGVAFFGDGAVSNFGGIDGIKGGVGFAFGYGNILNQGSILATNGEGVNFAGGNLNNAGTNAYISAQSYGVHSLGTGTATNQGKIEGGTVGIRFATGGSVINSGTGAVISGGKYGVNLETRYTYSDHEYGETTYFGVYFQPPVQPGTVFNQGTIISNGSNGTGICLQDGGIVNNYGTAALISGGGYGVDAGAAVSTVINQGIISGHRVGLAFGGGGTIVNTGTIAGNFAVGVFGDSRVIVEQGALFNGSVFAFRGFSNTLEFGSVTSGVGIDAITKGSFVNFNTIDFDPGASWLVPTSAYDTFISTAGFGLGDTFVIENFSESSAAFAAGSGLTLTGTLLPPKLNPSPGKLTFAMQGSLSINDFKISTDGTNTTIFESMVTNATVIPGTRQTVASGITLSSPTLAGGALVISEGASVTGTISFTGTGGDLVIEPSGATTTIPLATISGFAAGDTIELAGVPFTRTGGRFGTPGEDTYTVATAGTLTIDADGTEFNILIAGAMVGQDNFVLANDLQVTLLCYLHGTRILTPTGVVKVEDLAIGDAVVTRFGAVQRIKWLGRQNYAPEFLANNPEKWPVRIEAGALDEGVPARHLYVSPGHSMLLGEVLVLASRLVNGVTITQTRQETEVSYVQIELAGHDCVLAEGAWSETYADAPGLRAQFHNAAEFYALYPDTPPVEELLLCAKRPERGVALVSALLPVVARAEAGVTPGVLEGWVDAAGEWSISGWARDLAHPELPLRLEILVGEKVIGTVLACQFREDLPRAGKGSGRCAFSFTPPFRLRAAHVAALVIRRAVDGEAVPGGGALAGGGMNVVQEVG